VPNDGLMKRHQYRSDSSLRFCETAMIDNYFKEVSGRSDWQLRISPPGM